MIDYNVLAIRSLVKDCEFSWDYPFEWKNLSWKDERPCPTKEEWEAEKTKLITKQPLQDCKSKAKQLISNTDWSVLPDVNITNKSEFESYRNILRNYIINPIENPEFPIEPQPIWKVE